MSQLQRHRPIVKNPRTKGCDVFLWRFNKNSIREQLDDMRTPVIDHQSQQKLVVGWEDYVASVQIMSRDKNILSRQMSFMSRKSDIMLWLSHI